MKVYKLEGKACCHLCGQDATLYIDVLDTVVCRKCGVELYRQLGTHFVPRAVPNVILRSENENRPLSAPLYENVEKQSEGSNVSCAPFKSPSRNFTNKFKGKRKHKNRLKPFFKGINGEKIKLFESLRRNK